jgi:hypothetical protein
MNRYAPAAMILLLVLGGAIGLARDDRETAVKGRVIEFTEVDGFDQLTIARKDGSRMAVRLGRAGTCRNAVTAGDRVRIRLAGDCPAGGVPQARGMRVRRTGASYEFRNGTAAMTGHRDQDRLRDGSCTGAGGRGSGRGAGGGGGGGARGGTGGGGSRGGGR